MPATATWRLLPSGPGAPAWNQALDEALLRSADRRPLLRLYGWELQALSLGYFQPLEPFVDVARGAGVVIVRRATGGGAIHHADELTFSIVATPGSDGYSADIVPAYDAGESFDGWIVLPVLAPRSAYRISGAGLEGRARLQIRANAYFVS